MDVIDFSLSEWEALKQSAQLGDFILPCCQAPAVLKTSIRGVPFFAHLTDECATAPCGGQVISDTTIGSRAAIFRS